MRCLSLIIVYFSLASFACADIYKWIDENGKVHYSDAKPDSIGAEEVKIRVNNYTNTIDANSNSGSQTNQVEQVVMYSTAWCGYCEKARRYFQDNDIKFTEYDIEKSSNARAKYDKLRGTGIPLIMVGKRRMDGFSVESFERLYRQHN